MLPGWTERVVHQGGGDCMRDGFSGGCVAAAVGAAAVSAISMVRAGTSNAGLIIASVAVGVREEIVVKAVAMVHAGTIAISHFVAAVNVGVR
mmetsp:Transcript_28240/g.59751  ORF Transcript_28240/g.59751 Transcript_28240/m.59751 type:complete len:92 (-) Transcript_28240:210-485(-)